MSATTIPKMTRERLTRHLLRDHGLESAHPLSRWRMEELEDSHDQAHIEESRNTYEPTGVMP